ncbi:hypothetical protein [Kutzneria buriramensis]|uniref:Uncharacterized protein n=1 Tax=Kutzneria buriramensis TaxID=1045776 RepID=A0A3E0HEE6_9PSEU|nr:hypothetical protein [Kutzneria buriramensis]REH43644.1 hypothetical protein BCF44_109187 [Kutzneria buriramensis]
MLKRLQNRLFEAIVAFDISPLHIYGLIVLGVCLLTFTQNTSFELVGGNYTNLISALVSTLVLREARAQHRDLTRRHRWLSQDVQALHDHLGITTDPQERP